MLMSFRTRSRRWMRLDRANRLAAVRPIDDHFEVTAGNLVAISYPLIGRASPEIGPCFYTGPPRSAGG